MKVALRTRWRAPVLPALEDGRQQDKTEFELADATFNETGEWDQGKQNNVINTLAAQGYNAFGIFGVSPTDINSTFEELKSKGSAVGSLGVLPGR